MTEEEKEKCRGKMIHDRAFWRRMAILGDKKELKEAIREIEREKHEKHPTMVSEV